MKRFMLHAALLATLAAGPALAQPAPPKPGDDAAPMMSIDRDTFLQMVASANDWEIRSSELANKKTSDEGIKQFAHMIITDHVGAAVKLKERLETKQEGADSMPPAALVPKHERMLQQLEAAANGPEFDTLYLDMQAQAHMEAVGLFRTYAGSGEDQTLVGFARETLPTLETHLGHVKHLIGAE